MRATLGRRLLCSRHNGRQPRGLPLHDHVQPQVLRHIMYADYKYQDRYFIILLTLLSLLLLYADLEFVATGSRVKFLSAV